jgi:hypothetical protein
MLRVLAVLSLVSTLALGQNPAAVDVHAWADRDHFREANAKLNGAETGIAAWLCLADRCWPGGTCRRAFLIRIM